MPLFVLLLVGAAPFSATARAQEPASGFVPPSPGASVAANHESNCKIVYLGLIGGLEFPGNPASGVVKLRKLLRSADYSDVCANAYSPYVWMAGLHWVLRHFPSHAGALTPAELASAPKVILVGHSLGGWGVISVARQLKRKGIPVELSVQIDSVGFTDHTVPANVHEAAIFHARDVLSPIVTKSIRMDDASRTKLVEDVFVEGAGHQSITRDPRIRELVLRTIDDLRAGETTLIPAARTPNVN